MILNLSDETWERVVDALPLELVTELTQMPELPSDRELVAMARRGDDAPEAVRRVRAARDAAIDAQAVTRAQMNDMVRHIRGTGISGPTIARWFGLKSSRVYEILNGQA